MLPCSIGSLEWRQSEQIRETCQTAAQSAKGGEEWGEQGDNNPGRRAAKRVKERRGTGRERNGQGENKAGAELKMHTGSAG